VRPNHTLALLRKRAPALGLWLQTHSFHVSRTIAAQGLFDWLLLDMEHTPVDLHAASTILAAIGDVSGGQCTPLARVAGNTAEHIKHALDAGAQGILVPMVSTADEARAAIRHARFPPLGERGGGGIAPHFAFGMTSHVEYIARANAETLVAVQIETVEGVANIDDIVAVDGIDLVFVGPFDLHLSLGLPPSLWSTDPRFLAAVDRVLAACMSRGLPVGTLAPDAAAAELRLQQGFRFVGIGTDLNHMLGALRAQRGALPTRKRDVDIPRGSAS
jgi:2-keto-3-deoxy-L-rhamnonate aldolase RhmA